MSIKLLVCDIDGTLTGEDNKVSKRVKQALDSCKKNNVIVALATGRMHGSALPFVDLLGANGPVISYNGGLIINTKTNKCMRSCPMTLSHAKEVLEFARENNIYAQYYSQNEYYIVRECDKSRYYHNATGIQGIAVDTELVEAINFDPYKILFICDEDTKDEIYVKAIEKFSHKLEVVRSKRLYVEFNHPEANKGFACDDLAKHYGIEIEDTMAIGDGHNDLSMLKWAGVGVAMGNSSKDVKENANCVTLSQEEDGAAIAIENFILKDYCTT